MVCPVYREKNRCGLHSKFYDLSPETIDKYCKKDPIFCGEFLGNIKKVIELTQNDSGLNDTYTAIATIVKKQNSVYLPSKKERLELRCDFSWLHSISNFIPKN